MSETTPTIHASAVLIGSGAVLIRGASGSGKSRLVLDLLRAADQGLIRFARLVADDRVHLENAHERLLVRPPAALVGLIEVRGLGLQQMPHEPLARVTMVIDLEVPDTERLPAPELFWTLIEGIRLPRLAVAPGMEPLPLLLQFVAATLECDR